VTDQSPPPPEWIYKRDGRLDPFDADRLCRSLFAATERLGRPDAFTARELTDGVLHFLAGETENRVATTAQVAETVVKVVRELGHPALAQAYAAGAGQKTKVAIVPRVRPNVPFAVDAVANPQARERRAAAAMMRDFALREVFARELVSAHEEGLLTLTGLEAPLELSGWLLGPPGRAGVFEGIEAARRVAGGFVAIDGPEHVLVDVDVSSAPDTFLRELSLGLRLAGLAGVVNLNAALPPPWAGDLADGPLFAGQRPAPPAERRARIAAELRERLLKPDAGAPAIRVDWHLGEADLAAESNSLLMSLVRRAVDGAPLAFVFDRPRRPMLLAEGIDRQHPAVLMTVGLHLPRLVAELERRQGAMPDPGQFLEKLRSLARLALSAGVQKRNFLRRSDRAWPAFLLDRARLVVAPVGLETVTRRLTGLRISEGGAGIDFACRVVQRLTDVLTADGRACQLDACLDGAAGGFPFALSAHAELPAEDQVAGVTPWDTKASAKQQLKAGGTLHTGGTVAVLVPDDAAPSLEELAGLLRSAWRQGDVGRLRFLRADGAHRQMTAPWLGADGN
jgi:hypothetical protein